MLHPFLTTIFVILQVLPLVAYVTGFQSSAIKVIHNHDLYGIQQLSGYNFAHNTKKVVCHQQFVGSDDSKGEEPEVVIQIEDLSPSQIAELIEVSFIQACMVSAFVCGFVYSFHVSRTRLTIHSHIVVILAFENIATFTRIRRRIKTIYCLSKVSLPTMR
jgi:hypothetical protein